MPTKAIPDEYHTVTPYLVMRDAAQAIDFYKRALGATETFRFSAPLLRHCLRRLRFI
jgi:PhnB protein